MATNSAGYSTGPVVAWCTERPTSTRSTCTAAANAVLFPSTWEGFGNPPVEAAMHDLPAASARTPSPTNSADWASTGSRPTTPAHSADSAPDPDHAILAHNRDVARTHLSLESMTEALRALFDEAGWTVGRHGDQPRDPVLEQRARASRLADLGQRIGYGLFGLALVVFFVGLIGDFTGGISTAIIVCVVVGSIVCSGNRRRLLRREGGGARRPRART